MRAAYSLAALSGREGRGQTSAGTCCYRETRRRRSAASSAQKVITGSQPSVLQSSFPGRGGPDLVFGAGSTSGSVAPTMVVSQRTLKVKCASISSNYPVSAMLIHTWALLAVSWSAGAGLNNGNNYYN